MECATTTTQNYKNYEENNKELNEIIKAILMKSKSDQISSPSQKRENTNGYTKVLPTRIQNKNGNEKDIEKLTLPRGKQAQIQAHNNSEIEKKEKKT